METIISKKRFGSTFATHLRVFTHIATVFMPMLKQTRKLSRTPIRLLELNNFIDYIKGGVILLALKIVPLPNTNYLESFEPGLIN